MKTTDIRLNLIQQALQFEDLENFIDALKLMHLKEFIKIGGPFTVFAPLNAAFLNFAKRLPKEIENQNNGFSTILQYHVVPGKYYIAELKQQQQLITLIGKDLFPMYGKEQLWINEAKLVRGDFEASNGILHIVDRVLMPTVHNNQPLYAGR